MLLLRAVILELLVCFHVIGAAVLFRRLFSEGIAMAGADRADGSV